VTKPGFYCPAWDWSLGAPLQMVRFVAFTPLYGWGQAEGRAPVSVWAIPEDHGQKQVDEDVATIASVVNAATPALEPACGMSTTSLAVQLHSKIVVQLGDELFIIHNWRGRKRGVKVRPAVPWCAHGAKQNKTKQCAAFGFCFVSFRFIFRCSCCCNSMTNAVLMLYGRVPFGFNVSVASDLPGGCAWSSWPGAGQLAAGVAPRPRLDWFAGCTNIPGRCGIFFLCHASAVVIRDARFSVQGERGPITEWRRC